MRHNRLSGLLAAAVFFSVLVLPPRARSVCKGSPDSPPMKGMAWGVLALLVVVVGVLTGVASFFIYISRRTARTQSAESNFDTVANLNNV